jgi:hypothetical protein
VGVTALRHAAPIRAVRAQIVTFDQQHIVEVIR